MAQITLKGNKINTVGELPAVGSTAPSFTLVKNDLSEVSLDNFGMKKKVLNVFPSIDTPTCAMSVRSFNKSASELNNVVILNISMDLPFALSRFCGAEGIDNADTLSAFRSSFLNDYNVAFADGPLLGLLSRAIIILDENNKIIYTEQVSEIADEPNYETALKNLQ
jgi:thioredoxin-dependent peroxiredoxin